jgi:phosphomethylpyrimidine synthase
MCGHDWCSLRISKEITEFASGKEAAFQPERRAMRSPGIGDEGRALLRQRGTLPVVDGKHACHSDLVSEPEPAQHLQERLLGDANR